MNTRLELKTENIKVYGLGEKSFDIEAYVKWYIELLGSKDCLKGVTIIGTEIDIQWCDGSDWFTIDTSKYDLENAFAINIKEKNLLFSSDVAPTYLEIEEKSIKII